VQYIDTAYISQNCSRCVHFGKRNGKVFKCANCNYTGHADDHASFNIAKSSALISATEKKIGGKVIRLSRNLTTLVVSYSESCMFAREHCYARNIILKSLSSRV
jgi:transposase